MKLCPSPFSWSMLPFTRKQEYNINKPSGTLIHPQFLSLTHWTHPTFLSTSNLCLMSLASDLLLISYRGGSLSPLANIWPSSVLTCVGPWLPVAPDPSNMGPRGQHFCWGYPASKKGSHWQENHKHFFLMMGFFTSLKEKSHRPFMASRYLRELLVQSFRYEWLVEGISLNKNMMLNSKRW